MTSTLTTVASDTTVENFVQQAAEGKVRFYSVRANGSTRHIPFLALGTTDREVGEWVLDQREQGVSMASIAKDMHVSVPSVRRTINAMLLATEVEEYDAEEIAEILAEAGEDAVVTTEATNDQPETGTDADLPQTQEEFMALVHTILG